MNRQKALPPLGTFRLKLEVHQHVRHFRRSQMSKMWKIVIRFKMYLHIFSDRMTFYTVLSSTNIHTVLSSTCQTNIVRLIRSRIVIVFSHLRLNISSTFKNLSAMKTVTAACDAEVELDKDAKKPKGKVVSLLFN